ncbi:MAG: hypothetical protein DCC65_13465 [Planctomycetota bacterium]|nr:MAG: hypothetical protein DCC65_13465 [Planctomycetota bacterium]
MASKENGNGESIDWAGWIPVFPLPNVVLMPRQILPLHVFEPRYRAMTRHALAGNRLIAISLLRSGYEPFYHTLDAPIHPTVGVGRIMKEERLPDGRYNFLLQGVTRAVINAEDKTLEYRRAKLKPMDAEFVAPEVECAYRSNLRRLLTEPPLEHLTRQANWLSLFDCPDLSFSDLLDVLASAALPCTAEKQLFLEEPRVAKRAQRLCATLEVLGEQVQIVQAKACRPRAWPPDSCSN